MSANEFRDWPTPLRINVSSLELAPYLYYQTLQVYGGGRLWDTLTPQEQAPYVAAASDAIKAFAPAKPAMELPKAALRLVDK